MSKIRYKELRFQKDARDLIDRANAIIDQYSAQGYSLTLRQLYYRLVATDVNYENTIQQYKKLSSTMSRARYAGLTSWTAISDNHRNFNNIFIENELTAAVEDLARFYAPDRWQDQEDYIEVWVEKDALTDVISKPCKRWGVSYMACKGYMSSTQAWQAALRFGKAAQEGKNCYLLHLGDHDPSGIDMTRDNGARLGEFWCNVRVRRLALNMDQIEMYNPPPDPAKVTDSRFERYAAEHGDLSWELDALEPQVIDKLLDDTIQQHIDDPDAYNERVQETRDGRKVLDWMGENSFDIIDYVKGRMEDE